MTRRPLILQQLEDKGYAITEGLLDVEKDLQPIIDEYEQILEGLAHFLHTEGSLSSEHGNLSFGERLTILMQETNGAIYQNLEISLPKIGITVKTPMHHEPAVFQLLINPNLLDAVEELIGPEIYSNPVQHVRIKPPQQLLPTSQQKIALCRRLSGIRIKEQFVMTQTRLRYLPFGFRW